MNSLSEEIRIDGEELNDNQILRWADKVSDLEEQVEWFKTDRTTRAEKYDFLRRRVMELEKQKNKLLKEIEK